MEVIMKPEPGSLVLGGPGACPQPGSLVLGGTAIFLGKLFDRFLAQAIPCNGLYLRLEISDKVALVRKRRADIYSDIKVKYLFSSEGTYQGKPYTQDYWDFAGYLKHDGILFGSKARYVTAKCEKEIRPIVLYTLIEEGQKC